MIHEIMLILLGVHHYSLNSASKITDQEASVVASVSVLASSALYMAQYVFHQPELSDESRTILLHIKLVVQSIYEKYLANPPQIATEAIPTVLCSEQPPKSQKKSLGKSNWWNIVKIIYN